MLKYVAMLGITSMESCSCVHDGAAVVYICKIMWVWSRAQMWAWFHVYLSSQHCRLLGYLCVHDKTGRDKRGSTKEEGEAR